MFSPKSMSNLGRLTVQCRAQNFRIKYMAKLSIKKRKGRYNAKRIELFIECHTFLRSYKLAPHPSPAPILPSANCLSFSVFRVSPAQLATEGGGGGGHGADSYDRKKSWASIIVKLSLVKCYYFLGRHFRYNSLKK